MVFHPPAGIIARGADSGRYKSELPFWNMVLRGFLAGAYIAMGAALATVAFCGTTEILGIGMARIMLGAVFPLGLILIVLTGAELFTGDAMLAPLAAFIHRIRWKSVITLCIWVYLGNFIGSVFFAYIMANGPFVSFDASGTATVNAMGMTAVMIGAGKVQYIGIAATWSCFLKAVACNWLVNLAILLGICADDLIGKFFGLWFPIMAFVTLGFEHSIANMYFIPAAIFTREYLSPDQISLIGHETLDLLTWGTMWTNNLVMVTLGNIVGGLLFVGLLYWIAFKKEINESLQNP